MQNYQVLVGFERGRITVRWILFMHVGYWGISGAEISAFASVELIFSSGDLSSS